MVDQQVTFQQFLAEQRKTNQKLDQIIADEKEGDNFLASAKNAAAEIGNTILQERKNRKEHDETQKAIKTSVKDVEKAIVDQETTTSNQQKQIISNQKKAKKASADALDEFIKTSEIEKKILKQTDEQYEATLIQRARVEESKQILEDLRSSIQGDVEKNREYQKADMALKKQQLKLDKVERRRGLLKRFKDDEDKITFKSVGKEIKASGKRIFDVFGKFKALFGALLTGLFVLFTQSELFEGLRNFVKNFLKNVDSLSDLALKIVGVGLALVGLKSLIKDLPKSIATVLGVKPKPVKPPAGPAPTVTGQNVPSSGAGSRRVGTTMVDGQERDVFRSKKGNLVLGGQGAAKGQLTTNVLTQAQQSSMKVDKLPNQSSASTPNKNANLNAKGEKGILARTAALTAKFPAISRVLRFLPFLGPIIGGLEFYDIMTDPDASPKEKSKRGAALFAGTAIGLKGAAVGAMIGGPIGAALGGVAGFLLGDKLGEYTMGVIFGESIEDQIKNDIDRAKRFFTGSDELKQRVITRLTKRIAQDQATLEAPDRGEGSKTGGQKGLARKRIRDSREMIKTLRKALRDSEAEEAMKAEKMSKLSASPSSDAPVNALAVNAPVINQGANNETIVSSQLSTVPSGTTGLIASTIARGGGTLANISAMS